MNAIAYSYDGINWTGLGYTVLRTVNGIVYNGTDKWVAIGSGTTSRIAYSSNGTQWTATGGTTIFSFGRRVAYGNSLYIAVGDGSTNNIAWSNDGVIWTGLGTTVFGSGPSYGIAYGGGRWVALGSGGSNSIAYSDDGTQWTGIGTSIFTVTNVEGIGNVVYGTDKFVAVAGYASGGGNTISYSYNGSQWTGLGTTIFPSYADNIGHDGGRFIAMGRQDGGGNFTSAYSDDGITWTGIDKTLFSIYGRSVASDNAGISNNTVYAPIAYSTDLTTWTGVATTLMKHGNDIIYSDKFVCVGEAFTNSLNNILTSTDGTIWTAITNNLLNYSPTTSRVLSLDAEDLVGYTNGQAVTSWSGWTPDNPSFPPTYSTYNGGKFVLFGTNNQRLRFGSSLGLNSASNGWTINFQSINIPNGTILTLQSTSPSMSIVISYNNGMVITYTLSGVTTTMTFNSNKTDGFTGGGWFDYVISYNNLRHQFISNISARGNKANFTHVIDVPNASFNTVIFGGTGISNLYLNRIYIYDSYMEHLHNYNTSMSVMTDGVNIFTPSAFATNWRKQAIVLSKIAYGDNKYLICGKDYINEIYEYLSSNTPARRLVYNTPPLFKSTGDSNWSAFLNTGIQSLANGLKYTNSKFYIVSNEQYIPSNTNYASRPNRILTTSNLDYWVGVGDKNDILVPNLSLPSAISPRQILTSVSHIFLDYVTGVWYAIGLIDGYPMVIRNLNGYWTYDYPKLYFKNNNVLNPSSLITSVYSAVFKRWTDTSYTKMLISTNNGVYDYTFTSLNSTIIVPWYDTIGWNTSPVALFDIKNMLQDPFRDNSYYPSQNFTEHCNELFCY